MNGPSTSTRRSRFFVILSLCIAMLGSGAVKAGDETLIRIERTPGADRGALIDAGTTLVAELNDAWLAVGDPLTTAETATGMSLASEVIFTDSSEGSLALVGLRYQEAVDELSICGRIVARGDGWHLVHNDSVFPPECIESTQWFIRSLDLEPIQRHRTPPPDLAGLGDGSTTFVPHPLVQEIVDLVDIPLALAHWTALTDSPTWSTRYSPSQGCADAATYVHGLFESFGLDAEFQDYSATYADNVVGTIVGSVEPTQVYIAVGHLDDLPSSGLAPGADDNASGTAMVTAAAEVMSDYCFESTVKFLAVTGEEQGLHGSDHYADDAAFRGENILAVLNGDMIGWEGNGQPAEEDLDIIHNSNSAWIVQAMTNAAADYGTGLAINALLCPSMSQSDHYPFWSNGYPAICGITDDEGICGSGGNYPYYHQSNDTISNCGPGGPAFEAAAIRTYVATLAHLAQPIARIPADPTGVTALPDGANRIALSWLSQAPGIDVRIHRATGSCADPGPSTLIAETAGTSFVDTTASGGVPYAYNVTAVAAGSCTSAVAVCVDATTTGACTEPPVFAGADHLANAAASNCLLTVEWNSPDHVWCGGPVAYNVYRSETPGFTPSSLNRIANGVTATSLDDFDVVSGVPAHYIVRAVDQSHGNEDTNTHTVEGTPTGPAVVGTFSDDAGDSGSTKLIPANPWSVIADGGISNSAGYATGSYPSDTCAALTSPALILDASPQLDFWSKFDIESGWDKGELQITTDGGNTWNRVDMTYPGSSTHDNDECGLGPGSFFTGSQGSYSQFSADLSAWSGQEIILRWIFSSDGSLVGDGWWIDDVTITDVGVPGTCSSSGPIFTDGFESGDTDEWMP